MSIKRALPMSGLVMAAASMLAAANGIACGRCPFSSIRHVSVPVTIVVIIHVGTAVYNPITLARGLGLDRAYCNRSENSLFLRLNSTASGMEITIPFSDY